MDDGEEKKVQSNLILAILNDTKYSLALTHLLKFCFYTAVEQLKVYTLFLAFRVLKYLI